MNEDDSDYDADDAIAIVGMHCLLPGASSADAFWQNLCAGFEAVRDLSREELEKRGVPAALIDDPDYVKSAIELEGCDEFDYAFFGVSPRDASVMDPQHRKFLECAWGALEHAGHRPSDADGSIGMFASAGMPWYLIRNVLTHRKLVSDLGEFQVRHLSNDKDFLATRASYAMNIHGPSLTVQTACSSSLVAVHLAAQSLLMDECDIAIAGGSTIDVPHGVGYRYREEEVRSADGRCRAFDKDASGTAFGSGCGAVVLRRLRDAIDDGNTIYAVLRGTAVNNDGSEKAGYMAPSVNYQAAAIGEAIAIADVGPDDIEYFETHGTGTRIGDPIEIAALTQAFGQTERKQYCAIGSVKSNIGHLDTAAGVASLIKVVNCVRHGKIPESLHFKSANPEIDFESSPFFVSQALQDWDAGDKLRVAGVSSLGVGGTNAHAIVQQAPLIARASGEAPAIHVLPLSAKTPAALQAARENLAQWLQTNKVACLADVAYTLQEGRAEFACRVSVAATTSDEAASSLLSVKTVAGRAEEKPRRVAFMFSGQGAQFPGMGAGLYDTDNVFRAEMDRCLALLEDRCGVDLRPQLFAPRDDAARAAELQDTQLAQPALFALEYALAKSWMSRGVNPDVLIGHSLGEYVAATLAGVFTLEAALELIVTRGRLIASLPTGDMIAVSLKHEECREFLSGSAVIAGLNAPSLTVISGPADDIANVTEALSAAGHVPRQLHTSHAFHSPMLKPISEEYRAAVSHADPQPPSKPMYSNVSGALLQDTEASNADYWVTHLLSAIDFQGGLHSIVADSPAVFLEIGPGNTLCSLADLSLADMPGSATVASLPHARDDRADALVQHAALGSLWSHGVAVNWTEVRRGYRGLRIGLPTYSFERHRCWLEERLPAEHSAPPVERLPVESWGYVQNWRHELLAPVAEDASLDGVIAFLPPDETGAQLQMLLRRHSSRLVVVYPGERYANLGDGKFEIACDSASDLQAVLDAIDIQDYPSIVHGWLLGSVPKSTDLSCGAGLDIGFFSLLELAKVLQDKLKDQPCRLLIAAPDVHRLASEQIEPVNATVLGPLRVLPNEIPGLQARLVDISSAELRAQAEIQCNRLLNELLGWPDSEIAVWRANGRFVPSCDSLQLPKAVKALQSLQTGGVYLLTGAFGGIGRQVGEYLAREWQAKLILVSRGRPDGGDPAGTHARTAWLQRLESLGAEVHCVLSDLSDVGPLADGIGVAQQRFGQIDGVFHIAGHLDDALISMKSTDSAKSVLQPKIQGTQVLEAAVRSHEPNFFVLFSSISTLAGMPGQIDYAAANAYLDAFAASQNSTGSCRYLAIAWSSWEEVGMAVRGGIYQRLPIAYDGSLTAINDGVFSLTGMRSNGVDFFGELWAGKTWYLNGHRLKSGDALLPGTAYIQLIADAWRLMNGDVPLEISDLVFATPLQFVGNERKLIHCEFNRVIGEEDCWEVVMFSRDSQHGESIEHAGARVSGLNAQARPTGDSSELVEAIRGTERPDVVANPLLQFGERWDCLAARLYNNAEAVLKLELPSVFYADFVDASLHPAMLDIATGGAPDLFGAGSGDDVGIVPFQYRRIRIWQNLEPQIYSRIKRTTKPSEVTQESDIQILGASGDVLLEIDSFCVRLVDIAQLDAGSTGVHRGNAAATTTAAGPEGISNAEGMDIIERLLGNTTPAHVIIAPLPPEELIAGLLQRHTGDAADDADAEDDSASLLERPSLSTEYEPPTTDTEKVIAAIWEQVLGIAGIGVSDNFFELGGHSLLMTQVVSKLRRERNWNLPLDKVFDQLTIAEWAELAGSAEGSAPAMPKIGRVDRSRFKAGKTELQKIESGKR